MVEAEGEVEVKAKTQLRALKRLHYYFEMVVVVEGEEEVVLYLPAKIGMIMEFGQDAHAGKSYYKKAGAGAGVGAGVGAGAGKVGL